MKPIPCPFCGCPKISHGYIRDGGTTFCTKCGAQTHAYNPDSTEKSIEKWNRRSIYSHGPEASE